MFEMVRILSISLTALWFALVHSQPVLGDATLLVIKSSDNRFFNASIKSLRQHLQAGIDTRVMTLGDEDLDLENLPAADLVITLGFEAAEQMHDGPPHTPVIHAYLTGFQAKRHAATPLHSYVLLDQPLRRYLNFMRLLLDPQRVGIIVTKHDRHKPALLQQVGTDSGIDVIEAVHDTDDNLINGLRHLLERSDALLALPSPEIYNHRNLKGLLLTAYRMDKPVVSYSPSHVTSGALAAIYITPEKIGKQIAKLAMNTVSRADFQASPLYLADDFDVSTNDSVADSLGLEIPTREVLLRRLREEPGF